VVWEADSLRGAQNTARDLITVRGLRRERD
jgi:hypothetical protein